MNKLKVVRRETKKTLQEFRELYSSPVPFARSNLRHGRKLLLLYPRVGITFAVVSFALGLLVLSLFDQWNVNPPMEAKKYLLTGFLWLCSAYLLAVSIKGFIKKD